MHDPPTPCPPTATWEKLARGELRGEEESRLIGHLDGCAACAERVAGIATAWPRPEALDRPPSSDSTRRIVERIAENDPDSRRERRAPGPAPAIDGLSDLVEVGHGGMGVVYRAREERLGRTVAVKVLAGSSAHHPEGHRRAEREARVLTRIAHPNIVQILYVTEAADAPAIVMEWIDGPSLDVRGRDRAIAPREAAGIVADLARAVSAVHACGIVHRDIKPANVLLATAPGGGSLPKLVDFGLARPEAAAGSVTRASVTVGTPSFMAPEQTGLDPALGSVGPATDVHALGALLYWLLSGKAPYEASSTHATLKRAVEADAPRLSSSVPRLPRDLVTIVEKCLAQRPERRYRSADALADDLGRFLAHRPVHARRSGVVERAAKWARRHPAYAALAASATAASVALVVVSTHYVRGLERANLAITASRDKAIGAETLARQSFAKLTDAAAERLIARGGALDDGDRDHLRRIRDQYRDWPLEPDAASGLRFRAAGLDRLSQIFLRLSWVDDAIDSVAGALENLAELEARGMAEPEDDRRRHDLELFHSGLLISTDRLDEAAAATKAAMERLERGAAARPEFARHLPGALSGLAIVESRQGKPGEAAGHFRRALDLCDRLLAESPDDVEVLKLALPVCFNAASTPTTASSPDDRTALYEHVVVLAESGLARFGTDREFLGSSAIMALHSLADIELDRGRPEMALEQVRRCGTLVRRLAAEMPQSEPITTEALTLANQSYRCQAALGRPGDAEGELAEAVATAARAVAAEPALVSRARALAWLLDSQAEMFSATGRDSEALEASRRLLDAAAPWTKGPGTDPQLSARADSARERIAALEAAIAAPVDATGE